MRGQTCGTQLGEFGSPYNAVMVRRAIDHQEWDIYYFLDLLLAKSDQ
jgi:hypothetical protein